MFNIKTLNNISDIIYTELMPEKYLVSDEITDYQGVLVRSADMHDMALSSEVLAIARAGAGTNNIPVDECSQKGIVVFNTPGANANAVKELVLCGLLLSGRKVASAMNWVSTQKNNDNLDKDVEKNKKQFVGPELRGKKLGVIGLGAIGVMVANGAWHGLEMEVMGYDPALSVQSAWHLSHSIKLVKSIDEIFRECDFITLHLPLNDKTKGMIDKKVLDMMKPRSVLLNFARGGLVVSDDVLESLKSNHLRAYITDFPDNKLINQEGVTCIPHLGASTPESEDNCAKMAAAELKEFLETGNIKNSVNFPSCELPRMDSYRICIINQNITNMIGQISTVLAEEKMNIEHMANSSKGAWAYTILDVLTEPNEKCIEKLQNIEGVIRVRVIKP